MVPTIFLFSRISYLYFEKVNYESLNKVCALTFESQNICINICVCVCLCKLLCVFYVCLYNFKQPRAFSF